MENTTRGYRFVLSPHYPDPGPNRFQQKEYVGIQQD